MLGWSIASVGLMIAYYYGQTGIACVVYFRRYIFKSVKNFFLVGVLPLVGGLILAFVFAWSLKDMTDPAFTDPAVSWLGFNPVFFIGLGTLLAGIPLMFWWNRHDRAFFRVKTDPIDRRPPPEGGTAAAPARLARSTSLMAGEIVVGYDGQEGAVAALRTATAIAAAFKRPLVIVFGYRPAPIGGEVAPTGAGGARGRRTDDVRGARPGQGSRSVG